MNTIDKVNKAISIPMLAMCAASAITNFQNGDIYWGISMVICCAWWIYVIYKLYFSKKQ